MAKGDLVPNRLPEFIRMLQQQSGSSLVPAPPQLGVGSNGRVNIGPATYSNPALPMGDIPQPVASSRPSLGAGAIPMGAGDPIRATPSNGALFADPKNIDLASLRDPNPRYAAPRGNLTSGTYLSGPNGGLGQQIPQAPMTPPKVTASTGLGEYATAPGRVTMPPDPMADYRTGPGSVSQTVANTADDVVPAAARSGMGWKGALKSGLGGALAGYGASLGLGMGANAIRPQNAQMADMLQAGGQIAPIGGMIGVPAAGAMGWSGLGATAVGTTAPILGAAIAQGFTGSEFGNETVNAIRGSEEAPWMDAAKTRGLIEKGDYAGAASQALGDLTSPIWQLGANFLSGGKPTDDDLLDVANSGLGGGETAEAAPKLPPQEVLNNAWNMTGMEQGLRDSMQVVYDLRVQAGEKPEEVAAEMLDDIIGEYQMRQTQQQELGQLAAQQEQAMKYMRPYVDNIRAQGLAQSEALRGMSGMLPPQFQGYSEMAIMGATQRANQLADSLMAQASLAPSQAMQQRHLQAQQSYESQLAQQIQAIEIQNQLAQMQASGQAPVPLAETGL